MSNLISTQVNSIEDCLSISRIIASSKSLSEITQQLTTFDSFESIPQDEQKSFISDYFYLTRTILNFFIVSDVQIIYQKSVKPTTESFHRSVAALSKMIRGLDKIRAVYKGYKQRKSYFNLIKSSYKDKHSEKDKKSSDFIMKEFKKLVSYRKLTLEQCFRAADKDSDGQVSHQELQNFIEGLQLSIPKSYLSKFITLLDEDCSGVITKEEYYKTLSAFSVQSESQNASGRTVQQEALIKFTESLKNRQIEPEEMFNLCDLDMSKTISLKELERYIKVLGIGFQEKEVAALMKLFDNNGNGEISLEEFLQYMEKGNRALFQIEQTKGTQAMNATQTFSVSLVLEIGKSSLFDILDEVKYFLNQEKFIEICKNINPRLTPNDTSNLIKALFLTSSNQVTRAEVEEFCLYYTELHMLSKEQYSQKVRVILKRNKLNFRIICEKENLRGVLEPSHINFIFKKFLNFTQSQIRKFLSLFEITDYITSESLDALIQPLGPVDILHQALEEYNLDLNKLFDLADKKKSGKVSSTDFELAAVIELKNIESKILTDLVLMFPMPRIDRPTFLKIFRQETRIEKFVKIEEPEKIPQEPAPEKKENEEIVKKGGKRRGTLFVYGESGRGDILRKFLEQCPQNLLTHEYIEKIGLLLRQLIDKEKFFTFATMFKISRIESNEIFRIFDLKKTGFVYGYSVIFTLESIRNPIEQVPTYDNAFARAEAKVILERLMSSLEPEVPIYKYFPSLTQIVDWDSLFPDKLKESEKNVLINDFPNPCFYYQIAAVLETYSTQQFLCGELALYALIERNKINKQGSEYFEDIPCEEQFTRSVLISKLLKYMLRIEAESIYQLVYGNEENKPVYHLFTIFDYALTWFKNKIQRPISLPIKGNEKNDPTVTSYFIKIAKSFDKPLQAYGFSLQDDNSDIGFSQLFERALQIPRNETIQCIRLLKPTNDHRIKLYHIIYVLDSYHSTGINVSSLKNYFNSLIHEFLPYGATFVISCGQFLSQQIPQSALSSTFSFMPEADRESFIHKINSTGRNFVFGYEIASEIDKLQYQIVKETPKVLESLQSIGNQVSPKSLEVPENDLKQLMSIESFFQAVKGFVSKDQALTVWNGLKIESFSKLPYYTFYASLAKFVDFNTYNKPNDIRILGLCIPDSIPTVEFFPRIDLGKVLTTEEAAEMLVQVGKVDSNIAITIAGKADARNIGKFFVFELFTLVDLIRSSTKAGRIVGELFNIPISSNNSTAQSLKQFLKMVASELDFNNVPTVEQYSKLKEFNVLTLRTLLSAFPDLPESNLRELFVSLSFMQSGMLYYHLMAIIESYRTKFVEMKPAESSVKVLIRDSKASIKEAKFKLKSYILGDNPKKRQLTSKEIFGVMDKNGDGTITSEEFMASLDMLRLNLTATEKIALTKEVDVNKDEKINYEEILNYLEEGNENIEILGLENSISSFPKDSLDYAIFKLKTYINLNKTGNNSLENVFLLLDEDKSGGLNETEFNIALNRLKLGISEVQKKKLKDWSPKSGNSEVLYRDFFKLICSYQFTNPPKPGQQDPAPVAIKGIPAPQTQEKKKLNPDTDFFNTNKKCTTILNSEEAALIRCLELFEGVDYFKDPDFGPEVGKNGDICLYWSGKQPSSNFPPAAELKWKSPKEWLKNAGFFKGGISSNDVIQGSLGDCWFIGALSVLAQRDELVRGSVENLLSDSQVTQDNVLGISKGVYPPLFHYFAKKGLFVFRFFANSGWRWVIIDDRIPIVEQEGYEPEYVFGHCKDQTELWVSLIEKAYAKLYGCYESLNGGLIDDALVDLTGYVAEKTKIKINSPTEAENLWAQLSQYKRDKCLMGCSIDSEGVESDVVIDGQPCGLLARHAYAIIDIIQIDDPSTIKKRHRLVRLRNPWGQREWNGKWSDNSQEVNKHLEKLQNELKKLGSDEEYNPNDGNDGTFLMCFRDWRNIFHNLYSCVDFSDEWWGVRFFGEWTTFNSGGVPMSANKQDAVNWAKNPQYVVDIRKDCQVFISLSQDDGRFIKGSVFPYEGQVKTACFTVMRLGPTEETTKFFDQSKIIKLSVLKLHRTIEMRESLRAGKYVIVPATIKPGMTGKFSLSIYLNCAKTEADIFNPADKVKGALIEEEEEMGTENITPNILEKYKNIVKDVTRRK